MSDLRAAVGAVEQDLRVFAGASTDESFEVMRKVADRIAAILAAHPEPDTYRCPLCVQADAALEK